MCGWAICKFTSRWSWQQTACLHISSWNSTGLIMPRCSTSHSPWSDVPVTSRCSRLCCPVSLTWTFNQTFEPPFDIQPQQLNLGQPTFEPTQHSTQNSTTRHSTQHSIHPSTFYLNNLNNLDQASCQLDIRPKMASTPTQPGPYTRPMDGILKWRMRTFLESLICVAIETALWEGNRSTKYDKIRYRKLQTWNGNSEK